MNSNQNNNRGKGGGNKRNMTAIVSILLWALVLTLLVNRQTPANPDTHYTGTNGVSVYYDSSIWKVCQMTEDSTLGTVLELATADSADGAEDYQPYCCSAAPPTPTRTSSTILRRT